MRAERPWVTHTSHADLHKDYVYRDPDRVEDLAALVAEQDRCDRLAGYDRENRQSAEPDERTL